MLLPTVIVPLSVIVVVVFINDVLVLGVLLVWPVLGFSLSQAFRPYLSHASAILAKDPFFVALVLFVASQCNRFGWWIRMIVTIIHFCCLSVGYRRFMFISVNFGSYMSDEVVIFPVCRVHQLRDCHQRFEKSVKKSICAVFIR